MLSEENLEKLGSLQQENTIMAKFLKDNKLEMADVASEIESNMPFAMSYYNEEARTPYLFRRISSTSTIKSVYFNSSPSSSASQESTGREIKLLLEAKPNKNLYYNIMVAGDSGLGKTSFISTYMYLKFNFFHKFEDSLDVLPTTHEIRHNKARRTDGKTEFYIDMIDTPGYGSYRNVKLWIKYITKYCMDQIIEYKQTSSKIDTRVHCCLFFIDTVLKQSDIYALKELQNYTSIIPVIAKADTCTTEEIKNYKKTILSQLIEAEIAVYCHEEVCSNKTHEFHSPLGDCPPYSVISAVSRIHSGTHYYYGRKYLWGFCDINNPFHSDFPLLNKYLIGKFYYHLKACSKEKITKVYNIWLKNQERLIKLKKKIACKKKVEKMQQLTKLISCMALGIIQLIRK
jgi:septin family protein